MNQGEFQTEINRLIETYGKNAYGLERSRIIWQEVKSFHIDWLRKTVNTLIATHRQAPLPADFSEAISIERERVWKIEKAQNAQDAKDFWSGRSIMGDDARWVCRTIVKRMDLNQELMAAESGAKTVDEAEQVRIKRVAGDKEWAMFISALENIPGKSA